MCTEAWGLCLVSSDDRLVSISGGDVSRRRAIIGGERNEDARAAKVSPDKKTCETEETIGTLGKQEHGDPDPVFVGFLPWEEKHFTPASCQAGSRERKQRT